MHNVHKPAKLLFLAPLPSPKIHSNEVELLRWHPSSKWCWADGKRWIGLTVNQIRSALFSKKFHMKVLSGKKNLQIKWTYIAASRTMLQRRW